jgi:hypothetical protein
MSRYNKILNNIKELINTTTNIKSNEHESPEVELMEYKQDFLNMNIGSLRAIMQHAASILKAVESNDEMVKNNLTESWLQGKIAITEDYMRTIHDFVKYVSDDDDTTTTTAGCGCGGNKKKPNVETTKAEPEQTQQQSQKEEKPQS